MTDDVMTTKVDRIFSFTIPSTRENFIGIHLIVLEILAAGRFRHPPQKTKKRPSLDRVKNVKWAFNELYNLQNSVQSLPNMLETVFTGKHPL